MAYVTIDGLDFESDKMSGEARQFLPPSSARVVTPMMIYCIHFTLR